jgi:hypothetical protein
MLKRIAVVVMVAAFIALAVAPEAMACNRRRSRAASFNPYRSGYSYNPYRYRGVASDRYYSNRYNSDRYYGGGRRNGIGNTGRAILTVGAPAAVGAGVGALLDGKRGAAVGALLGGGGGAAYYLIKNRGRRR